MILKVVIMGSQWSFVCSVGRLQYHMGIAES